MTTSIRFPTTALPVQVQRVFLSDASHGEAPLTTAAKLLDLQTISKASQAFEAVGLKYVPVLLLNTAKEFLRFSVK